FTAGQQDIQEVLRNSLDTFVDLSGLRYGTIYYWQVTVDDGENRINGPVNCSIPLECPAGLP
ncbi:MAG: hypothetical protein AAFP19_08220, partial [Bacteroidota bacterium]